MIIIRGPFSEARWIIETCFPSAVYTYFDLCISLTKGMIPKETKRRLRKLGFLVCKRRPRIIICAAADGVIVLDGSAVPGFQTWSEQLGNGER